MREQVAHALVRRFVFCAGSTFPATYAHHLSTPGSPIIHTGNPPTHTHTPHMHKKHPPPCQPLPAAPLRSCCGAWTAPAAEGRAYQVDQAEVGRGDGAIACVSPLGNPRTHACPEHAPAPPPHTWCSSPGSKVASWMSSVAPAPARTSAGHGRVSPGAWGTARAGVRCPAVSRGAASKEQYQKVRRGVIVVPCRRLFSPASLLGPHRHQIPRPPHQSLTAGSPTAHLSTPSSTPAGAPAPPQRHHGSGSLQQTASARGPGRWGPGPVPGRPAVCVRWQQLAHEKFHVIQGCTGLWSLPGGVCVHLIISFAALGG